MRRNALPIECAATLTKSRDRIAIGQFPLSAAFRHGWYSDEGKLWRLFGSLLRSRTPDAYEVCPAASPPETYVITTIAMHPATAGHQLPFCSTLSSTYCVARTVARVLRASRILSRWDSSISLSYSTRALIMWTIILLAVLHLFTCTWGLAAQLSGSLRTTELKHAIDARQLNDSACVGCGVLSSSAASVSACRSDCLTSCEVSTLAELTGFSTVYVVNQQSWLCRGEFHGLLRSDKPVEAYFHALLRWSYFSQNLIDCVVGFIIYFISQFFWSMFIGTICGTVATPYVHNPNMDPPLC